MADREALGVALQLLASFAAAAGYVLQKAAHLENEARPAEKRLPVWRSFKWVLGLVFMFGSAGCAVASAPMLDQSKQATLGAATIVFNGLLAWAVLRDPLTVLDALSIAVIVVGTIVAMASAEASATYTFKETLALLNDDLVFAYLGLALPAAAAGMFFVERAASLPREEWSPGQATLMRLAPPLLGGWCNNQVLYASKVVTTVVFGGEAAALQTFAFYVYAAVGVCAVVLQVRYLNAGLAHFPASVIVPLFQVTIILGGALAGIVYFHDLRYSPPDKVASFVIGALICAGGIGLLQVKAARQQRFDAAAAAAAAAAKEAAAVVGGSGKAAAGDADGGGTPAVLSLDGADTPSALAPPLSVSTAASLSRTDESVGFLPLDSTPVAAAGGGAGDAHVVSNPLASVQAAAAAAAANRSLRVHTMAVPPPTALPTTAAATPGAGEGSAVDAGGRGASSSNPLEALAVARKRNAATHGLQAQPSALALATTTPAVADSDDKPAGPSLERRWFDLSVAEAARAAAAHWRARQAGSASAAPAPGAVAGGTAPPRDDWR